MKRLFLRPFKNGLFAAALVFLFGTMLFTAPPVSGANPSPDEIEQYVRARIDMGEGMGGFFKNRKPPQFGPDGGPSMEELRNLEQEINTFIAGILSKHGLTIEKYQTRSPDVFADEAGVKHFLSAHPDLKARYEHLPQSPGRGGRAH